MSSAEEQVAALYQGLSGFLNPVIPKYVAVQLVIIGIIYAIATALYTFALVFEIVTKRKKSGALWFFRVSNEAKGRYVMVNVLFIWMPLAIIYCTLAGVSAHWHIQNDQGSGSQRGNIAWLMLPLLVLEAAAWLAACTLLFSGFHLIGAISSSNRGQYHLRVPPPWFYHFLLFGLPGILIVTTVTLSLIGNTNFDRAVDTAESLVAMISSGHIDPTILGINSALFAEQTSNASYYANTAGYIALGMLTVLVLMGLPSSIILMAAMRQSSKLRSTSGAASSGLISSASMQKLLWFYGCYGFCWSMSVIIYQYYNLAQKLSDNGISYAVEILTPNYIHAIFNLGGSVYLVIRAVVSSKVEKLTHSQNATSEAHSRAKGGLGSRGVHVLTETAVHHDDEERFKSRTSLDYEDKQIGLDIALEHIKV